MPNMVAMTECAAVPILNVSGMNDGMNQQALCIDENMPLLALDLLSRIVARPINRKPPFFSAFDALTIDDGGGGTGLPSPRFSAFYIELMMDEIERAIPTPQVKIIVQGRARRQVFRDRPPLTSSAQNIHDAVHHSHAR